MLHLVQSTQARRQDANNLGLKILSLVVLRVPRGQSYNNLYPGVHGPHKALRWHTLVVKSDKAIELPYRMYQTNVLITVSTSRIPKSRNYTLQSTHHTNEWAQIRHLMQQFSHYFFARCL